MMTSPERCYTPKLQVILLGINRLKNFNDGNPHIFSTDALGCMYTVCPSNDECFYLRLLLVNVRDQTSFQHLTVMVKIEWHI